MIETIRYGTFETNSSSCHSLTINVSLDDINQFNNHEKWYCHIDNKCFYTSEEIVKKLKESVDNKDFENVGCHGWYKFTEIDSLFDSVWLNDESDFEIFKQFISNNLTVNMFDWAFNDSTEPKYFSKVLIRNFIKAWIEDIWDSPLLTIKDIVNEKFGNSCYISLENFYNGEFKIRDNKLVPYSSDIQKRPYQFVIDIRN